jgi:hypothetical protein
MRKQLRLIFQDLSVWGGFIIYVPTTVPLQHTQLILRQYGIAYCNDDGVLTLYTPDGTGYLSQYAMTYETSGGFGPHYRFFV